MKVFEYTAGPICYAPPYAIELFMCIDGVVELLLLIGLGLPVNVSPNKRDCNPARVVMHTIPRHQRLIDQIDHDLRLLLNYH